MKQHHLYTSDKHGCKKIVFSIQPSRQTQHFSIQIMASKHITENFQTLAVDDHEYTKLHAYKFNKVRWYRTINQFVLVYMTYKVIQISRHYVTNKLCMYRFVRIFQ